MRVISVKRSKETSVTVDQTFTINELDHFLPQVVYLVNVLPGTPKTYDLLSGKLILEQFSPN